MLYVVFLLLLPVGTLVFIAAAVVALVRQAKSSVAILITSVSFLAGWFLFARGVDYLTQTFGLPDGLDFEIHLGGAAAYFVCSIVIFVWARRTSALIGHLGFPIEPLKSSAPSDSDSV